MRDVGQLIRVCRALLRRVGLESLWTDDGPTEQAKRLLGKEGESLAADKRTMLLLAWRFHSGAYQVRGTDLWELDNATQKAVMNLATAMEDGDDAVDRWLELETVSEDEE